MRHAIRWTLEKISARIQNLEDMLFRNQVNLPPFAYTELSEMDPEPGALDNPPGTSWIEIQPFSYWGKPRQNFLLKTTFTFPGGWPAGEETALFLPIGKAGDFSHPEALVMIDGVPWASCDRHHQEIILSADFLDGREHTLLLRGWTGLGGGLVGNPDQRLQMGRCEMVQVDQPTRTWITLARTAVGVIKHLPEENPARHHLLNALQKAYLLLDLHQAPREEFYTSVRRSLEVLRQELQKSGSALDVRVQAVGHAHIDVAWLWTLAQTRRKTRRTFYNVHRLLERYPDFYFTQSQPQLYDFIREDDPGLFKKIQSWVAEKRWEPIGGMWVEADCNITGGESLARQFLLGRNFFREYFGKNADSPVLWLPDVFGYAWNLPQLIKEAGLEYFFTIKIGWNQYNRLPHDSFWWQGLDGTRVLTHFSTTKEPGSPYASTYNSDASAEQVMGTWFNFQDKDYGKTGSIPPLLMAYGWGDGGGGPTSEMIENIREMKQFPGAPRVQMSRVEDFFQSLEESARELPVWNGELYLEYHRGTYTTQARTKQANRRMEFALHDAEFTACLADALGNEYHYPHEELERAWRKLCLNQFHDILPGSSIGEVYRDAARHYRDIRETASRVTREALECIADELGAQALLVNPTSFERNELIRVDHEWRGTGPLPPYSVTVIQPGGEDITLQGEMICEPGRLENYYLSLEFNQDGDLVSIYDKREERQILAPGAVGNQLQVFEDRPLAWDAWDIDIYYDDRMWLPGPARDVRVLEAGPLRAALEITRNLRSSTITQVISLQHNSRRIDFHTRVDWRERQTLLKAAFPVNILSPTAAYEIQWGNVERPTHRNTSWDWARFETAAQKWVDLSEGGYGVSLLNDSKYGHDIHDQTLRLTLLRGAVMPDPAADLGEHEFTYSLFPHPGRWGRDTIREAYALNDPLMVFIRDEENGRSPDHGRRVVFCRVDQPNLVIETVKKARDGRGWIIRLYDTRRQRGEFTLATDFTLREAWRANILEEDQEALQVSKNTVRGSYKPFQILTLRLIPGGE